MKKIFNLILFLLLLISFANSVYSLDPHWYTVGVSSGYINYTEGHAGSNCGASYCTTNAQITELTTGDNIYDNGSNGETKGMVVNDNNAPESTSGTIPQYFWDSAYPVLGASPAGIPTRETSNITINLSESDLGGSNRSWTNYILDDEALCASSGIAFVNNDQYILNIDGEHTLHLCGEDNAGNYSTGSYNFKLDKVAPTVNYIMSGGSHDIWTKNDVTVTVDCNDFSSGCDNTTAWYVIKDTNFTCDNTTTGWLSGDHYDFSAPTTTLEKYICFRQKDNAGNGFSYSTVAAVKIDNTKPDIDDIDILGGIPFTIDSTTGDYILDDFILANHDKNIVLTVDNNAGAPIISIEGEIESHTGSLMIHQESNSDNDSGVLSSLDFNTNMSLVDNDIEFGNYREYSLRITNIEDEVGNKIDTLPEFIFRIVAGNIDSTNSQVTGNTNFYNQIANGESKKLKLILKDVYGNKIVPVSTNGYRNVSLTANFNNSLYLNQYSLNGASAVSVTNFDGTTYDIALGSLTTNNIIDNGNDGIYDLNFKVYAPTATGGTDYRKYARGNFQIVNFTGSVSDINGNVDINNSLIDFDFKPLYSIEVSGELTETGSGFDEGTIQTGSLDMNHLGGTIYGDFSASTSGIYMVHTGSTDVGADPSTFDYFTGTGSLTNTYKTIPYMTLGSFPFITGSPLESIDGGFVNKIIKTIFSLTNINGTIDDIKNIVVEQYIKYNIDGKEVTYLGYLLNNQNSQAFETLKIYGITNISENKQIDIVDDQDEKDIQNLDGEIEKSSLKRDIRKNAIQISKFITPEDGNSNINSLLGDSWDSTNNDGAILGNVLYFGSGTTDVKLNPVGNLEGIKTIIVKGKNLYITSNVINDSLNDILGIIVIQDDDGNGGKVYIDPSVTEIDAIIYADKSLIGYSTAVGEINGMVAKSYISNQLYIYGSVFSENTIGGSRMDPWVCPYWFTGNCTIEEAQKYDLNYLRAGINNKVDNSYPDYPIVIKYNPGVQITPPPLFGE